MDRQIVYPGAIPLETDLLHTNRNAMFGLAKLACAVLGKNTLLNGLKWVSRSNENLKIWIAPGEIYSMQNIDGTDYSSIPANTNHQILKQGIQWQTVELLFLAPLTQGHSINYLVQVGYQDLDEEPIVLPYYNAGNPSQAYSGPNNSGTSQCTVRSGRCIVSTKAGISAPTGAQTPPAPDEGKVGTYVVTVAYGQKALEEEDIRMIDDAPFLNSTLLGLNPSFEVSPNVPTPNQLDVSQKAVNSKFVKQAIDESRKQVNLTLTRANYATKSDMESRQPKGEYVTKEEFDSKQRRYVQASGIQAGLELHRLSERCVAIRADEQAVGAIFTDMNSEIIWKTEAKEFAQVRHKKDLPDGYVLVGLDSYGDDRVPLIRLRGVKLMIRIKQNDET